MTKAPRRKLNPVTIACFGEALWDVLPAGMFVGGAPLNVAYHLSRQGAHARLITAVGRDFLGNELQRRLRDWQIDGRCVAQLRRWPTGTVLARLDADGVPAYNIRRRVAWDHIRAPAALERDPPAALVFGTLALREKPNRAVLSRLAGSWPNAWRVLDLNLRPPFTTRAAVTFALERAQFVKLNAAELATLTQEPKRTPAAIRRAARRWADTSGIPRLCVTAGPQGAGVLWDGAWYWENGRRVTVRDTVGAGDAFLAAFLAGVLLRHESPPAALAAACRMGEFVASRSGATPAYHVDAQGKPRDPQARQVRGEKY